MLSEEKIMRKQTLLLALALLLAAPVILMGEENPDKLPWRSDIQAAFDEAKEKGKPIVLNFTTPWNIGG